MASYQDLVAQKAALEKQLAPMDDFVFAQAHVRCLRNNDHGTISPPSCGTWTPSGQTFLPSIVETSRSSTAPSRFRPLRIWTSTPW